MNHRKKILFLLFLVAIIFVFGCGNDTEVTEKTPVSSNEETEILDGNLPEMTLEELSLYDGSDGNPAYIAYEGYVYDLSDSSAWSRGSHGGFSPGRDLTAEVDAAPHGNAKVETLEKVAVLAEGEKEE